MKNVCYNIDNMEFMKNIPDKYYELAIVDPPYGINAGEMKMGRGSRNDKNKNKSKKWDKKRPDSKYFDELFRISINQIVWGGNYFIDDLKDTQCFLLWDKLDYNSDFASHELAWTSFDSVVKCFRRARNMSDEIKIHPTQKPVELYLWLLKNYAKPGDKIFDSHVGSGSIRIACDELGFEFEGCEKDIDHWNDQEKRFKNHKDQLLLFGGK